MGPGKESIQQIKERITKIIYEGFDAPWGPWGDRPALDLAISILGWRMAWYFVDSHDGSDADAFFNEIVDALRLSFDHETTKWQAEPNPIEELKANWTGTTLTCGNCGTTQLGPHDAELAQTCPDCGNPFQ